MANKLKTHSCDSKEQHLFELFCNIKNVFTVTFDFIPFCIKVLISFKKNIATPLCQNTNKNDFIVNDLKLDE